MLHKMKTAAVASVNCLSSLRGVYTGDVGLAISLSDVISIPRSIDFKWYIHFKSVPRR
jgi:hypothetical protein